MLELPPMGPITIQMHWFLGTTKIPMGFPTVQPSESGKTPNNRHRLPAHLMAWYSDFKDLGLQPVAQSLLPANPSSGFVSFPPPQKKKTARPGGSTHTQTNKSFDQACHVWVTGQKSELHKKCYISAHTRLTSTGTENLKDIRSSSSRKPWETYGDWTIYTVPPLSTKTHPSKWKLFPLAKKGENKTYSKHYDLYIGAC